MRRRLAQRAGRRPPVGGVPGALEEPGQEEPDPGGAAVEIAGERRQRRGQDAGPRILLAVRVAYPAAASAVPLNGTTR